MKEIFNITVLVFIIITSLAAPLGLYIIYKMYRKLFPSLRYYSIYFKTESHIYVLFAKLDKDSYPDILHVKEELVLMDKPATRVDINLITEITKEQYDFLQERLTSNLIKNAGTV